MFFKNRQAEADRRAAADRLRMELEAAAQADARLRAEERAAQKARAKEEEARQLAEEEQHKTEQLALGYEGAVSAVHAAASVNCDYTEKTLLLEGAVRAFNAGYPENLRAFMSGYLTFKSKDGALRGLERDEPDEGLRVLAVETVMDLVENSTSPRDTLVVLVGGLSPYFAQTLMDLTLRQAVLNNNAYVCEQLLDLGADVNCHEGRPLFIAYDNDFLQTAAVLLKYKPEVKLTQIRQVDDGYTDDFKAFIKQAEAYPLPQSIAASKLFAENADIVTKKKDRQKEPVATEAAATETTRKPLTQPVV